MRGISFAGSTLFTRNNNAIPKSVRGRLLVNFSGTKCRRFLHKLHEHKDTHLKSAPLGTLAVGSVCENTSFATPSPFDTRFVLRIEKYLPRFPAPFLTVSSVCQLLSLRTVQPHTVQHAAPRTSPSSKADSATDSATVKVKGRKV